MNNEWYTPEEIITKARLTMGGIDLDPASCEAANRIVRSTRFYTKEEDGLTLPWSGRVWCNPPFSAGDCARFVHKTVDSFQLGEVQQALLLVPVIGYSRWFSRLTETGALCFVSGKIQFYGPEWDTCGVKTHRWPLLIAYLGNNSPAFVKQFHEIGSIFTPAIPPETGSPVTLLPDKLPFQLH